MKTLETYGRYPLQYVRTDRNGTEIYHDINCPRCSGFGHADKWMFTGSTCYACGGTGKRIQPKVVKIYTPEYEAKLEAKRAAKAAQEQPEAQQVAQEVKDAKVGMWKRQGFNDDGIGYVHYGDTFKRRYYLQGQGGVWCSYMKAYIAPQPIEVSGVKYIEIKTADVCDHDGYINAEKAFDIRDTLLK